MSLHSDTHTETCSCSEETVDPTVDPTVDSMILETLGVEQMDDDKEQNHELSDNYQQFLKELELKTTPEEKIASILEFMEKAITQGESPAFKQFWEARKLCLNFFKEQTLPFAVRTHLWNKYVEISKEAYRLKEILDEQSAFAVEQIELAIKVLEEDIEKNSKDHASDTGSFEVVPKVLESKLKEYLQLQDSLSFLNAFAARINSLRKELIKTEMRIRFKNKFFQRLSLAGDKVFPRRKDLIKEVSQKFSDDVTAFIQDNFLSDRFKHPLFFLREEIKSLQGMAKVLTLNTQAFNQTRMQLSECWDKIKVLEKERKKQQAKVKAEFKDHVDAIEAKLQEFHQSFDSGTLGQNAAHEMLEEINKLIKDSTLSRDDVKLLRDKLTVARSKVSEKVNAEQREKQQKEREEKQKIRDQFKVIVSKLEELNKHGETKSPEELTGQCTSLKAEADLLDLTKWERHDLERQFRTLADLISNQRIRHLPEDAQKAYEQLKEMLAESLEKRRSIREQLEIYRKASGSSGLDLEQAFKQQELFEHEKERLQKVDEDIEQIRSKMKELE